MTRFKVGDTVRCVKASDIGYPGVVGEVLTVRYVDGAGLYFKEAHHSGSASPNRFELVKRVAARKPIKPQPHDTVIESRFEIRLDQGFGYKAITRAPRTQKEAEEFIKRNAGSYAAPSTSLLNLDGGSTPQFDIVKVEVIHRETRVRSVTRKHIPATYELVDA